MGIPLGLQISDRRLQRGHGLALRRIGRDQRVLRCRELRLQIIPHALQRGHRAGRQAELPLQLGHSRRLCLELGQRRLQLAERVARRIAFGLEPAHPLVDRHTVGLAQLLDSRLGGGEFGLEGGDPGLGFCLVRGPRRVELGHGRLDRRALGGGSFQRRLERGDPSTSLGQILEQLAHGRTPLGDDSLDGLGRLQLQPGQSLLRRDQGVRGLGQRRLLLRGQRPVGFPLAFREIGVPGQGRLGFAQLGQLRLERRALRLGASQLVEPRFGRDQGVRGLGQRRLLLPCQRAK